MRIFILCLAISTILSPLLPIDLYLCNDLSFTFPCLTNKQTRQSFLDHHFIQDPAVCQVLDTIYTTLSSCEPHAISSWKTFQTIQGHGSNMVGSIDELPGFVLKYCLPQKEINGLQHIFRLFIAERMREFIRQQNYTKVYIPLKCLYLPPKASRDTDKQFLVIAEKIPGLPDRTTNKLNLRHLPLSACQQALDELFNVIAYGCYSDASYANIFAVFAHDGSFSHFALIDTEPIGLHFIDTSTKESFLRAAKTGLEIFSHSLKSDTRPYWKKKMNEWKHHYGLTASRRRQNSTRNPTRP